MNVHAPKPQTQPSAADLLHRNAPPTQHQKLVHQSQRLVSQTFFGTMLKQMRQSPFKSDKFSGGRGGQAFSELLDQHLADRMARGSGKKIVNSMVKRIEHNQRIAAAASKMSAAAAGKKPGPTTLPTVRKVSPHVPTDLRA